MSCPFGKTPSSQHILSKVVCLATLSGVNHSNHSYALGLADYSQNLKESGIHGALIAMDGNFRAEDLALALKIPNNHPVS